MVELKSTPSVLLAVCYCKPAPDGGILDRTTTILQAAMARHPYHGLIALGDFNLPNIRWTPSAQGTGWARATVTRPNQRSTGFLDSCMLAGLCQHVSQPTRGDNTLDLVLSSMLHVETTVRQGVFESDHCEVTCVVQQVKHHVPLVTRAKAFDYKHADFDGLCEALHLLPWSILDDSEVDDAVDLFYSLLDAAIAEYIPVVCIKRKFPPWFDREIRGVLREK